MRCNERQRADSGWPAGVSWGLVLCALLSAQLAGEAPGLAEPGVLEQALACVQDSMTGSPAPWPDAWRQEYTQAIREMVKSHEATAHYDKRLAILCSGFPAYWEGLKKTQDRSLFEVHCAEIRWYLECLMDAELPGDEETNALRNQYEDLFYYAASSLLTQFPFLDPNAVRAAQADHLAECYRRIEAPLLPIYLEPFSQAHIDRIKQRWHDLRYARVDLWRQLGGDASISAGDANARPINTRPHYLLTQRSLAQLQAQLWATVGPAPGYYRSAVASHIAAQKRRLQSRSQAWAEERRLEKERSRQFLQTEQIAFLLAALLESPQCFDEPPSAEAQENIPPKQQDSSVKRGGTRGRE